MATNHVAAAALTSPVVATGCTAPYTVRLAGNAADREAACRLRFEVFNLEMNEGLSRSYVTGLDQDAFDEVCDHLLVQSGSEVVGTYRMQTGSRAQHNLGYYSAQEFDFRPFEPLRARVLELGRACIHRDHRNFEVLTMLWRGIAQYASCHDARYLLGCSSIPSQDPCVGAAAYRELQLFLAPAEFQTVPVDKFRLPASCEATAGTKIPKLLRTYLALGAKICGPPAIDREFKSIDFLTLLDLETLNPRTRLRYFRA